MIPLVKLSFIWLLVLSSCASNEERWRGSINDFTSRYVDELRHLSSQDSVESQRKMKEVFPHFDFLSIEKAWAKSKNKKGLKKPLILKTKQVRKIQKSQARRMTKIDAYKVKKHIGEKDNGLIGICSLKGLDKTEKEELRKLVTAENKDRNKLYSLISKASGYTKKMETVLRKSFFDSYQEWAPTGTYYYTNNKWQKK